jgi:hypothetical protein
MMSKIRTLVFFIMSISISNFTQAQNAVTVPQQTTSGASVPPTVSETTPAPTSITLQPAQYSSDEMYMDQMMAMNDVYTPGMMRSIGGMNFIIPASQMKAEDRLVIERDMRIMSHIFDQVLRKPQMIGGVFTVMDDFFGRDSHVTQTLFVDGYGALFFIKVNLPLTGSSESPKGKESEQTEEHTDTIWKRAEQELYSPQNLDNNRSDQEYDADKIEVLKKDLVEGLKHATNIQALKPDNWVILTVVGKAQPTAKRLEWQFQNNNWRPSQVNARRVTFQPSILTIRAKKSDIDAFSKGELNLDQFAKQTQVFIQ